MFFEIILFTSYIAYIIIIQTCLCDDLKKSYTFTRNQIAHGCNLILTEDSNCKNTTSSNMCILKKTKPRDFILEQDNWLIIPSKSISCNCTHHNKYYS